MNTKTINDGFFTIEELPAIEAQNRLRLILVRCGGCRFVAPAQDVHHIIAMIKASGMDYVRDISFSI